MSGVLQTVCPACKAQNEAGSLMCKRCGEIISKKGKTSKNVEGYNADEGSFKPSCVIIPIALSLIIGLVLFFSFRGPKAGTCEYNRQKIVSALFKFNRANPSQKMTTLDMETLMKQDSKGKSYLKDKPVCPVNPTAQYQIDEAGTVICTNCIKRK
ncbi:MAG: hypothetical protein HQM10_23265 [Candidatus Riflebacteria bacterium]|nr:hypothetical protein [Candidatus Riflebacteria bacterium]